MSKHVKLAVTINQKWYVTLVIAILLNIGWNFINSKTAISQGERITQLEKENLQLKQTNVELLSKNFLDQHNLDRLPFALWRKMKVGDSFVMKFINETGRDQFLKTKGINKYFYHNKTDFAIFEYEDAYRFYREDSLVAYAKTDTVAHFNTNFYDAKGKILYKDGYTRWKEVVDGDTLIWGKMDKFYVKPKRAK